MSDTAGPELGLGPAEPLEIGPLFSWGFLFPQSGLGVRRDGFEFYRLAPPNVILQTLGLGDFDYTTQAGVDEAIVRVGDRSARLAREGADRIILGGVPISAFVGRERLRRLLAETSEDVGVPLDAPLEAVLAAMAHLGLRKLAIGSRWAGDVNEAVLRYLDDGGLEVVGTTDRGQHLADALRMTLHEGARMALEVGREASRNFPRADVIYVPGGAALSLHVIPTLEAEFGKPVLTSLAAEFWHGLVAPGIVPPIAGWGTLLGSGVA